MRFKFSDDRTNEILKGIYSGEINEFNLPEDLYNSFSQYFENALYSGYGGTLADFDGEYLAMLKDLRENVYMFSAAKTFNEIQELQGLKADAQTLEEFIEAGKETMNLWNDTRGFTEYVTAAGNAQMANKWTDILDKKDVLPMLTFSTDGYACDECEPFDNFSAPVEDPIWGWLTPLLHFNCHCILLQGDETVQASDNYDKIAGMKDNVPEAFQFNPGADREVFSSKHPFFDVGEKYEDFAKTNFGLPIPEGVKEITSTTIQGKFGGSVKIYEGGDANKNEQHLEASKILANNGNRIKLLPEIDKDLKELRKQFFPEFATNNFSNPDARFNGVLGDFKIPDEKIITKGIINDGIYLTAKKGVSICCFDLQGKEYNVTEIARGISGALKPKDRNKSLEEVWVILKNKKVVKIKRSKVQTVSFEKLVELLK